MHFVRWIQIAACALAYLQANAAFGFVEISGLAHTNLVQAKVTWPGASQIAVMVNSTNLTEARWKPIRPTVTVDLGQGDGLKNVWFFVASTNGGIWRFMREVKLDTAPFRFVLEKPTETRVTVTPLDWVGYFTRFASKPQCQLRNSQGEESEVELLIVTMADRDDATFLSGSDSHHNLLTVSAADMPVTPGTNVVTIRALDDSDRPFQTNVTLVLDYSRLTKAPSIALLSPQPGAEVSGSEFTIRGFTDTPGASITARIKRDGGEAESHEAFVETSGIFWLEELPTARTNQVEIIARNERNLESRTNFTVTKAAYNLTMNPVPEARLWDPFVTVTGTLDDTNYTVWVNGVRALLKADGTWSANKVPTVPGNTAVFEVTAVPNSENGGFRASAAQLPVMPPAELLLPRNVTARLMRHPKPEEMLARHRRFSDAGPTMIQSPTNLAVVVTASKLLRRTGTRDLSESVNENANILHRVGLAGVAVLAGVFGWRSFIAKRGVKP